MRVMRQCISKPLEGATTSPTHSATSSNTVDSSPHFESLPSLFVGKGHQVYSPQDNPFPLKLFPWTVYYLYTWVGLEIPAEALRRTTEIVAYNKGETQRLARLPSCMLSRCSFSNYTATIAMDWAVDSVSRSDLNIFRYPLSCLHLWFLRPPIHYPSTFYHLDITHML